MWPEDDDSPEYKEFGFMYAEGRGVPQNYVETVKRWRKAADLGNAEAQGNLGFMYKKGWGVPKDDVEAAKWYRKAADQGVALAQCSLGLMYAQGRGVPRDDVEAYAWFNISAVSNQAAKKIRDKFDLTPEDKARAQQRSTELFNEIEARKKAAGK
jgi:TPR repeat protein